METLVFHGLNNNKVFLSFSILNIVIAFFMSQFFYESQE